MSQRSAQIGRARVRLRNGRLYAATVELEPGLVHLTAAARLSRHLDGYVCTRIADTTVPRRQVQWIRWEAA